MGEQRRRGRSGGCGRWCFRMESIVGGDDDVDPFAPAHGGSTPSCTTQGVRVPSSAVDVPAAGEGEWYGQGARREGLELDVFDLVELLHVDAYGASLKLHCYLTC